MKKIFLYAIILFIFLQIKASTDFLMQIYAKIDNDRYSEVKVDLTKNIESLTIKNIKTVLELLKNKKNLHENTVNLNSGFANSSKTAASIIGFTWLTTASTAFTLRFLNNTRTVYEDTTSTYTAEFKNIFYKKALYANGLAAIIAAVATYCSGKKLFNAIYNNKKEVSKKRIEEIMGIETYLKNRLLILNQ